MTTLRVIVADDEPIALRGLIRLLGKLRDVQVVGEADNGAAALQLIHEQQPNVAFLDVQMPGGTGLEVARTLPANERPAIVFVTAYDRFAIEAFEIHAVDYLLKPFDEHRLAIAVDRVRERIQAHVNRDAAQQVSSVNHRLDALLAALSSDMPSASTAIPAGDKPAAVLEDTFVVRDGERVIFVPLLELDWCEAADNYVRLHAKGRKHLIRETMRNLELRLATVRNSPARFARIHRSMIVNLARVREIKPAGGGEYAVTLADGTKLALSRGYRDRVLAMLGFVTE